MSNPRPQITRPPYIKAQWGAPTLVMLDTKTQEWVSRIPIPMPAQPHRMDCNPKLDTRIQQPAEPCHPLRLNPSPTQPLHTTSELVHPLGDPTLSSSPIQLLYTIKFRSISSNKLRPQHNPRLLPSGNCRKARLQHRKQSALRRRSPRLAPMVVHSLPSADSTQRNGARRHRSRRKVLK